MACFHVSEHGGRTSSKLFGVFHDHAEPVFFGAAQGSSIDFEAGKYEYDPTAIAVQDTVIMVDKPDAQRGRTQAANNFNVQYETVRSPAAFTSLSIHFPPLIMTLCTFP